MPVMKQLPLQHCKPLTHLRTDGRAFRGGGEIALDVGPVQLATMQGQPAVSAMAISDDTARGLPQHNAWPAWFSG